MSYFKKIKTYELLDQVNLGDVNCEPSYEQLTMFAQSMMVKVNERSKLAEQKFREKMEKDYLLAKQQLKDYLMETN